MKNARFICLVFIWLLATIGVEAQTKESAVTPEQCMSDVNEWGNQELMHEYERAHQKVVADGTPDTSRVTKLSIVEIMHRTNELGNCSRIDEKKFVIGGADNQTLH